MPSKAIPAPRTPTRLRARNGCPYRMTSSDPSPVTTSEVSVTRANPFITAIAGFSLAVPDSNSIFCGVLTANPHGGLNGRTGGSDRVCTDTAEAHLNDHD